MPDNNNPRIKYKSRRTHNTFYQHPLICIANKTIPKTSISPKHNKLLFTEECKNMIRERQATLRKFKTNPSSENLNKYKQQRVKTRHIKESKRSSWRTFTLKINSNTNPPKIWDFIKKIINKKINNPINHFSQGNTKATNEKHIANLIAANFARVSSTKNYSN